jgi:hypothetical protein
MSLNLRKLGGAPSGKAQSTDDIDEPWIFAQRFIGIERIAHDAGSLDRADRDLGRSRTDQAWLLALVGSRKLPDTYRLSHFNRDARPAVLKAGAVTLNNFPWLDLYFRSE